MHTLLYHVYNGVVQIGEVYITHCTDLSLVNKLENFGEEGYNFLEIIQMIFDGDVDRIELILTQDSKVPRHETENTIVIPWKYIYTDH